MSYWKEVDSINASISDYTLSQATGAAMDTLFDLVNQTDTKRTLHLYAKFECLTLQANKRFNALSEHEKQRWKDKKIGIHKRPVFDLLNDARYTLEDRVNVNNPIDSTFIRQTFKEIGIPSKPYELLAIQEELLSMKQELTGDAIYAAAYEMKRKNPRMSWPYVCEHFGNERTDSKSFSQCVKAWAKRQGLPWENQSSGSKPKRNRNE